MTMHDSGFMKRFPLILAVMILFVSYAPAEVAAVKPTPTPASHRYGYKSKSTVHKNTNSDDDAPKAKRRSTPAKKTVKKTDENAAADQSTPTPAPSRKKISKLTSDDDEDAGKATPTSTPSKKKVHKKADDNDADAEAIPEPTPKSTVTPSPASTAQQSSANSAPNATLTSDEIAEFGKQPDKVQKLLESALELTRQNLTYIYGSADPANGGMDCSGFVYYVLRENGFNDVPRDASGQYVWVRKAKMFQAVLSTHKDSFELDDLRPGDLLFWTGTYNSQKDPPITHAMIYLGTEKKTHKSVMVGSTDGRTYDGKSRWGVSVFDFKANAQSPAAALADPKKQTRAAFVGYARIPGLRSE